MPVPERLFNKVRGLYPVTLLKQKILIHVISEDFFEILKIHFLQNTYGQLLLVGNKAKERISKRMFQENKARQNFRKTNISYPLIHVCVSGGKKCLFFGNFGVLCFLETPVLGFAFYLITDVLFHGKIFYH